MSAVRNRGKFHTLLVLVFFFISLFFCFSIRDDLLQIYEEALHPFSFLIIEDLSPENKVLDTGSISQQHDN